jgi:transcriptional regulator with XRE-family HTH domain
MDETYYNGAGVGLRKTGQGFQRSNITEKMRMSRMSVGQYENG